MVATTRSTFDRQLELLQKDVCRLAEMVETQLKQAIKALQQHDMALAWRVETYDATVNRMRFSIEEQCYTLVALQQPNGRDMRTIVAAVSIVTNLERMGDHAAGIARLVMDMNGKDAVLSVPEFDTMTEIATKNLLTAMDAMTTRNYLLVH